MILRWVTILVLYLVMATALEVVALIYADIRDDRTWLLPAIGSSLCFLCFALTVCDKPESKQKSGPAS